MSVDPVKMISKIHKLSGLVSEVCIRHLFTLLFVGCTCKNEGGGGIRYVFEMCVCMCFYVIFKRDVHSFDWGY